MGLWKDLRINLAAWIWPDYRHKANQLWHLRTILDQARTWLSYHYPVGQAVAEWITERDRVYSWTGPLAESPRSKWPGDVSTFREQLGYKFPNGDKGGWRCFCCDDVFTDRNAAALHFGQEDGTPICIIGAFEGGLVAHIRKLETENAELLNLLAEEGSQIARIHSAQGARVYESLRSAEETGYARGLRDARAEAPNVGNKEPAMNRIHAIGITTLQAAIVSDLLTRRLVDLAGPNTPAYQHPEMASATVLVENIKGLLTSLDNAINSKEITTEEREALTFYHLKFTGAPPNAI